MNDTKKSLTHEEVVRMHGEMTKYCNDHVLCEQCEVSMQYPEHKCGNGYTFGFGGGISESELIDYYNAAFGSDTATSQTVKADAGKPRLTLVPMQIMFDIAEVREYGNRKYPNGGKDNWKQVDTERHFEAMLRHIIKACDDYGKIDPESGLKHLSHAACDLAFVLAQLGESNDPNR